MTCADSEHARDEAAAIVLLAKARIGELTIAIESAKRGGKKDRGKSNVSRLETLKDEGISPKEAKECEVLAAMKGSGDLDRMLAKGGVSDDCRRGRSVKRSSRSLASRLRRRCQRSDLRESRGRLPSDGARRH